MKHRSDHARGRLSSESKHSPLERSSSPRWFILSGRVCFTVRLTNRRAPFLSLVPPRVPILPRYYACIEIAGRLIPTGPVIMTTRPTDKIEWTRNENLSVCTGNCILLRRFVTLRDGKGVKRACTCRQSERDRGTRGRGRMYRNTEHRKSRCMIRWFAARYQAPGHNDDNHRRRHHHRHLHGQRAPLDEGPAWKPRWLRLLDLLNEPG